MGIGDVKSRQFYIVLSEANNDLCLVFNGVDSIITFFLVNINFEDSDSREIKSQEKFSPHV